MKKFYNPVEIITGTDSFKNFVDQLDTMDKRVVCLVYNQDIIKIYLGELADKLELVEFNKSNPTVSDLLDYHNTLKLQPSDLLIAVGGGSVMDITKSLAAINGKDIQSIDQIRQTIKNHDYSSQPNAWVGVPTTSGTGSEVTSWATIWDLEMGRKLSVESRLIYARQAVLDINLTRGLPQKTAMSSSLDALVHAIESYWAKQTNPVSRQLALRAIKLILSNLDGLLDENYTDETLEGLALGSLMAGLAFSNTHSAGAHSISYPLTLKFNIPHGVAVSLLVGPLLDYNIKATKDSSDLLNALEVKDGQELQAKVTKYLSSVGIKTNLKNYGVTKSDFESIISASTTKGRADNNTVSLSHELVSQVLERIF